MWKLVGDADELSVLVQADDARNTFPLQTTEVLRAREQRQLRKEPF
jgi:hypothetical protein